MLPPTAYTSKYIHTAELFQRNIGLITLFFNTETLEQTPLSLKQIHWLRRECAWCYATFMLNSGVSLKKTNSRQTDGTAGKFTSNLRKLFQEISTTIVTESNAFHLPRC